MPIRRGFGWWARAAVAITGASGLMAAPLAASDGPLSAIDWLSQSVEVALPVPQGSVGGLQPGGSFAELALPAPQRRSMGVLPPAATGLPTDLWGPATGDEVSSALTALPDPTLPALREALRRLLLTESLSPADMTDPTMVILRVDRLLEMGALDQAQTLLDQISPTTPELFRRSFDVALLTGTETQACRRMVDNSGLAPTYPARIFCLARAGDWRAAAVSLRGAEALHELDSDEADLLSRFLDPDLYEADPPLTVPERITPLTWRIFDALGEGLPTTSLPLAFAHAELRPTAGLKAQIDAAERLSRAGAVTPNLLLGLYTQRPPAASGGVWDRVSGFQAFDTALGAAEGARNAATADQLSDSLVKVWPRMSGAGLEVVFAALYADRLISATPRLTPEAQAIALHMALLAPGYRALADAAARVAPPQTTADRFALAVAHAGTTLPDPATPLQSAIAAGLAHDRTLRDADRALLDTGRFGQAMIAAIGQLGRGSEGDFAGVQSGLALLVAMGQDDLARQTALQLMLVEQRG